MNFFLVKIDHFMDGYDPVETIHLIATDQSIADECKALLSGLWIDRAKRVEVNYAVFFNIQVRCELSDIKEIDEQTFDLFKELGL